MNLLNSLRQTILHLKLFLEILPHSCYIKLLYLYFMPWCSYYFEFYYYFRFQNFYTKDLQLFEKFYRYLKLETGIATTF
jgi:hypothetical protein